MNLPTALDSSPIEMPPLGLGGGSLDIIGLGISALVATVFVAYLLRCYFQEFWRARRIRHRKRLVRLKSFTFAATNREAIIEACRRRRALLMAPEAAAGLSQLDWRGLHSLIPSHDGVTLVWDTGRAYEDHSPRVDAVIQAAENELITASSHLSHR